jgi:cytochrome c5
MKSHLFQKRPRTFLTFVAALAISCAIAFGPHRADAKDSDVKKGAEKQIQKPAKTLTGAELYSMHCNRCHPERYPTERTAAQWKTILLHMRVRANLPAKQARTILTYLQDNSGR